MRIRAPVHLENPLYKGKQISSNVAFNNFSPEHDLSSDSQSSASDPDDEQTDADIGSDDSQTSSEKKATRGSKKKTGLSGDSGHDTKAGHGLNTSPDNESASSDSEGNELNGYAEGSKSPDGQSKMNGALSRHAQKIDMADSASESDENRPVEEEQFTSSAEGNSGGKALLCLASEPVFVKKMFENS